MEFLNFILNIISTAADAVSAFFTRNAKSEVTRPENKISGNNNTQNSGDIHINNKGTNQGVIVGVNTGDVQQ